MASESTRQIKLVRLAYVVYQHKDIEAARRFYVDFGFEETKREGNTTYYRGYGSEPVVLRAEAADENKFLGPVFVVESLEDLEYASKTLPDATPVQDSTAPGGGKIVTFTDPYDKFQFHLVYGQEPKTPEPISFPEMKINYPMEKNRPVNQKQRFQKRPAPVHKLGHFGLCVTNFDRSYEFYSTRFNFFPSELVHNAEGRNITVFFRLGREKELVDHHIFFFFEGPKYHVHHSSFETHDYDAQVLGHDWLRHQGYENCWGVGRHIMGSQIFDYWFDPSRFVMEHYVDGDLLDDTEPTHNTLASPDSLHVWGPDLPPTFLT